MPAERPLFDFKTWLFIVITAAGWAGNYFTVVTKLDRLVVDSATHVPRPEYEQRMQFHEQQIGNNYNRIEKISDYVQTKYPAWKEERQKYE